MLAHTSPSPRYIAVADFIEDVYAGRVDMVRYLINKGKDINDIRDMRGKTPLMFAAEAGDIKR